MKYKTGDIVKIKTWEEMKKEYGCSHGDSINCKYSFTKKYGNRY